MSTQDRRPYLTATVLDQELLDNSADNLTGKLDMIADITTPVGTIRVSDKAKFVGDFYYEPRVNFPVIERTLGDWLAGVLEFSSLDITVNNADGKFNNIMPGGADYDGFVGSDIDIKVGLNEVASTYTRIFKGKVTDVGGFQRDRTSFSFTVRSDLEKVNDTIPNQLFLLADFPNIEQDFENLSAPIIYGDWTVNLRPEAPEIPVFPINGNDPLVNNDLGNPSAGNTALRLVISSSPIKSLDTSSVTLFRGEDYHTFAPGDIAIVGGTNNTTIDITQKNLLIGGTPWIYAGGDVFYLKCVGVDLGANDDNIVEQARDILTRFTPAVIGEFDSSWDTFRDKAAPAQSAITSIKSRVWIQDGVDAFEYVLSMLEQVRLEVFVNRDDKFQLSSLHFEDFVAAPGFTVQNWDLGSDSLNPTISETTNFNRAKADFDFNPASGENRLSTPLFRNQSSIDQADGRLVSKLLTFPNLYISSDVENQLTEMIKLGSGFMEMVSVVLTPRAFLKELGEFVSLNVDIGAIIYPQIPSLFRRLGYDPKGPSIPATLMCFQLIDFPGYSGPSGTVGGSTATITQET